VFEPGESAIASFPNLKIWTPTLFPNLVLDILSIKDLSKLPYHPHLHFNPDLTFFELRVTQQARVHGFRVKSAFFLVWLDREHRIYPMK
jgi:hypothetical protein